MGSRFSSPRLSAEDETFQFGWNDELFWVPVITIDKSGANTAAIYSINADACLEVGRAIEHQESYLQTMFGFFGITDVRVI